jgi:branched-chain amino acid transport system substrate-binding protein
MLSRLRFLAVIAALAIAAPMSLRSAGAADVPGVTPNSILIGVQVALTGPASTVGQGFRAGIDMAVDEINAHGGINGRTIKTVYEDDNGTAEGGILAVRRLVEQDQVFAVMGGGTSTSTVSVIPLVEQGGVVYYDSLASDPRVLETYSPYVFSGMTIVRADIANSIIAALKKDMKAKTVGIVTSDEALCTAAVTLIEPQFQTNGLKLVVDQKFRSGDTDFSTQAAAVKAANPDALYMCGLPIDGGRLIPQLKRAGVTSKLLGDGTFTDANIIRVGGASIDGLYSFWIVSRQFIGETTGPIADWKERFAKKFPNPPAGVPNHYTLAAYSDMYCLAEGMRRAGRDLTRDKLIAGLETLHDYIAGTDKAFSYAAAIGTPRTFRKGDHKGARTTQLVVVRNGQFVAAH